MTYEGIEVDLSVAGLDELRESLRTEVTPEEPHSTPAPETREDPENKMAHATARTAQSQPASYFKNVTSS